MSLNKLQTQKEPVRSNAGMTLVELLVAIGIAGIGGLITSQIMISQSKNFRTVKQLAEINDIQETITNLVSVQDNCNANFQGLELDAAPINVPSLKEKSGKNIIVTDEKGQYVKLKNLRLDSFTPVHQGFGTVNLSSEFEKIGDTNDADKTLTRTASLYIRVDTNARSKVTECVGQVMAETACIDIGGRYVKETGNEPSHCILERLVITDSDTPTRSGTTGRFALRPKIGNATPGYIGGPGGDARGDSIFRIINSNADGVRGGFSFVHAHSNSTEPYPSTTLTSDKYVMTIHNDGRVGIGYSDRTGSNETPNIPGTLLYVDSAVRSEGNVYARNVYFSGSAYAGSSLWTSDERKKKDIHTIENALDKLLGLRGVRHEWRRNEFSSLKLPAGKDYGVIAQEVASLFPEAVSQDKDGYLWVHYQKLIPVTIEATKELAQRRDRISNTLDRLDTQLGESENLQASLLKQVRRQK